MIRYVRCALAPVPVVAVLGALAAASAIDAMAERERP